MTRPYRIILADDHVLLREGLRRIIEEQPGLQVSGEAGDGFALMKIVRKLSPDMVILDISMPRLRGIEAAREIKGCQPKIKILILTMHKDKEYLDQAIKAGVAGYLLKEAANKELFSAIEQIRRGRTYISPFFADEVTADWVQRSRGQRNNTKEKLTIREREILKMVAEGKTSKEIGALLSISARTVEHHRENMMHKLALKTTAELIQYAIHKGYV
jgi:DNA-binding NarL/FixJ family response regulator